MKKQRKKAKVCYMMIFFLCTILILGGFTMPVHAQNYYTFNNHKMIGGVGGSGTKYYYVASSAKNYSKYCTSAMNDWVYTTERLNYTTSISFKKTTTRSNSVIDILGTKNRGSHSKGVLAWTEFYKSGSTINPNNANWKYCYIKIYTPSLKASSSKGTIAHEIGHAFGLAHNNKNVKSIMCQTGSGRKVSTAQICDLKGINHLY